MNKLFIKQEELKQLSEFRVSIIKNSPLRTLFLEPMVCFKDILS